MLPKFRDVIVKLLRSCQRTVRHHHIFDMMKNIWNSQKILHQRDVCCIADDLSIVQQTEALVVRTEAASQLSLPLRQNKSFLLLKQYGWHWSPS